MMEKYLSEQYGVIEDTKYITSIDDIEDAVRDFGSEYLPCGQGYCTDKATVIIKIEDKFYSVTFEADIGSAKQDVGDRLYWVDEIIRIKYEEIPKPEPKPIFPTCYLFELTNDKKKVLERLLKENKIEWEIVS